MHQFENKDKVQGSNSREGRHDIRKVTGLLFREEVVDLEVFPSRGSNTVGREDDPATRRAAQIHLALQLAWMVNPTYYQQQQLSAFQHP